MLKPKNDTNFIATMKVNVYTTECRKMVLKMVVCLK